MTSIGVMVRRRGVCLLIVAACLASVRQARGETAGPIVEVSPAVSEPPPVVGPPPVPARPIAHDPDESLAAKQVGMSLLALAATGLLGYGMLVAADRADSEALAYGAMSLAAIAPAGVGIAVCEVGAGSKLYDGRCVPAVGGAYIGALSIIPGALLGALATCESPSSSTGNDDGFNNCFLGAFVGGALGYTIGTLVGAYHGWKIFRRPKPGTLRAALF
jgi:hypothetical protein